MEKQIPPWIKSKEVINILLTCKQIQKRMRDSDNLHLEFIQLYDKLGKEFDNFFTEYTNIFIAILRGENLSTIASTLFYKDKIVKGHMTESELSDKLTTKYWPPELKAEADKKLKMMKDQGEL
jgi:hypothetical protein